MAKYKKGDRIGCILPQTGVEEGVVIRIDKNTGKYVLKIPNGIAYVPIKVEDMYQLIDS